MEKQRAQERDHVKEVKSKRSALFAWSEATDKEFELDELPGGARRPPQYQQR